MASSKQKFGYVLVSAKTDKVVKLIYLPDILSDMKKELKSSSTFKGNYSDNVTMLLFNSLFANNYVLTNWLIKTIKNKGISNELLDIALYTKQFFTTQNEIQNLTEISDSFMLHIKSNLKYYEIPLILGDSYKNAEDDSEHLLFKKDLFNPFIAISKIGVDLSNRKEKYSQPFENIDKNHLELFDLYNLYIASKKISSSSLDEVKNAISVINSYIILYYEKLANFDINTFKARLSEYNNFVLNISKPATKEQIDNVKKYRSYIIELFKGFDFNQNYKELSCDYNPLFKEILLVLEPKYMSVTRYEDDIDYDIFSKLNDSEKIKQIYRYFQGLKNKGELEYKVSSDSTNYIIKLLLFLDKFNVIKDSKEQSKNGNSRQR